MSKADRVPPIFATTQRVQYLAFVVTLAPPGPTTPYLNYGEVDFSEIFDEDLSITNMVRALDVVTDPITGQPACVSALTGADPGVRALEHIRDGRRYAGGD